MENMHTDVRVLRERGTLLQQVFLRKLHSLRNFFFFNARALAKENWSVNIL